jgi:hypothetical protein
VQNGLFTFYLYCGSGNSSVFTGGERWIQAQVRSTGTVTYTTLPRQPISPAPYAFSLYPWAVISTTAVGGSFGDSILNVYNRNTVATWSAFHAKSASGNAVRGESDDGNAIYGYTENGYAVYGYDGGTTQTRGYGGYFYSTNGVGVYGSSGASRTWNNQYAPGVYGRSYNGVGVYGVSNSSASWMAGVLGENTGGGYGVLGTSTSASGYGGYFDNFSSGTALYANGNGVARNQATLRVNNTQASGGMAAYLTNNSNFHNAHFYNSGTGGVLYLQNGGTGPDGTGGGDFITAVNGDENDVQFRVTTTGDVYSDGNFHSGGADFAEMLPAVQDIKPGDVLIVGQDGKLVCSTQPFQTSVVGVYSTQPGFVGGQPAEGSQLDRVPLAVVGVVPVKASAENGAIHPGDLLVTSPTPGHAMKAGSNPPVGTVIGKALSALERGTGVIQMLVTLQ